MRAVRGFFGAGVNAVENPRHVLKQNIRELQDQVPKMNESIAEMKANHKTLERSLNRARDTRDRAENRLKQALESDREDVARKYAKRLDSAENEISALEPKVERARKSLEKAKEVKAAFMREKERKVNEAKTALREHERAEVQSDIADAMEQFEVGGLDQTHDEMVRRLQQKTARAEARTEMALDSVDSEELLIEEKAEESRAEELVEQYKNQLELPPAKEENADVEKTLGRTNA